MNKLIGLDIGQSSIKVASVAKNGDSYGLEAIAQIAAPPKGISSDAVLDLQTLAQTIKQLVTSSSIRTNSVALALPENQVFTKVIEMPQLSQTELSAALKFEMEQYIPLPIDKVKTDWQILGTNDQNANKTMNVMLVAAPIILLDKYQKIMDMAGLLAESIESEIISVHRALLPLISSSVSNMIVHMGAISTTIAIVRGGIIRMVFTIPSGGDALTRSISIELGIDMQQAENYKRTYGFSQNQMSGKVGKVLAAPVAAIVADVKKTMLSYREKYNNENIKQVILSGGSAVLPGLDVVMANALSTQVILGSAFAAYNMQNVPQELMVQSPAYNVVVGLALK